MLHVDIDDEWRWVPNPDGGYTVRGAYLILTDRLHPSVVVPATLLWWKDILVKVLVFSWRLFRDRLPTRANLCRRGIISHEAQVCVSGCGLHESGNYLFLTCSLMVRFDSLLRIGFVFTHRIHLIYWIIFISLVHLQVMLNHGVLSCIWSGLLVFGIFRRK